MSNESAVHALVREHGRGTTSFQVLGAGYRHWLDRDGCVGFMELGDCWVGIGGAVARPGCEHDVLERFTEHARREGKRVRFFALEHDVRPESALTGVHIGNQPVWDPTLWPGNLGKKLRDQLRRARTNDVVQTRLLPPEELEDRNHPTRRGVDRLIGQWFETRRSAPMGFLITLDPFNRLHERRIFVAEDKGKVVGMMVAMPVYGRSGWFIDNMMRAPDAPNGTVELIFDCAMQTFAKEGSRHVTLGLSPFVGVESKPIQVIRETFGGLYNFKGLYAFKTKLRPKSWEPVYFAYPKAERGVRAIIDLVRAFLPGGFRQFAWDSMAQRGKTTAAVVAAWLLPWTLVMGLADGARWFSSTPMRVLCVGLSALLAGLMVGQARSFRRNVSTAAAGLAVASAVTNATQILLFHAGRAPLAAWPWLAFSVLAPLWVGLWAWTARDPSYLYRRSGPLSRSESPAATPAAQVRPATVQAVRRDHVETRVRSAAGSVRSTSS